MWLPDLALDLLTSLKFSVGLSLDFDYDFLHSSLQLVCGVVSSLLFHRRLLVQNVFYLQICNGAQSCVTWSALPRTCLPTHVYPESTRRDRPGVWAGHSAVTQPWPETEHAGQRAPVPDGNLSVTGRRRRGCRTGRRCRVTNLRAFVVTNNRQPTERSARKCRRRPRVRRRRRRATSPTAPRRQTRATLPAPVLDIGVQTSPARVSWRQMSPITQQQCVRLHERALGGGKSQRHHPQNSAHPVKAVRTGLRVRRTRKHGSAPSYLQNAVCRHIPVSTVQLDILDVYRE